MIINELNYVSKAEEVIKSLSYQDKLGNTYVKLTTSKIRNLLSMVSELYNDAIRQRDDALSPEMQSRIQRLKVRIAYEAGRTTRDDDVKKFVENAQLFGIISEIGGSRKNLILFCNYFEALVAYHRYYGGKEQ
ncbi:MAG: type III-A CRISPR-associated protein Csm2 [Clostridiales bacterium]|nr:type III-A CRISPR-associated protein Csm2 [Clostridiales bacterium]